MTDHPRSRILVVDDEEAILETMTFTFEDEYEVLTSSSPEKALELLEQNGPVAVVLSDQRMPGMTGVEFLAKVFERHPSTTRVILTGFADMDATIRAINDGHVYAYVTKPWEQEELRQVIRRAADHYHLTLENERLLQQLRRVNVFLEAVMDQLDVGALAIDAEGVVREVNRPALRYLDLAQDPHGLPLGEVLGAATLGELRAATLRMVSEEDGASEDLSVSCGGCRRRLRVRIERLQDPDGRPLGSVILLREVSHEPLRMRFEELVAPLVRAEGPLREPLERAQGELRALAAEARSSQVASPGMADLAERVSRAVTAIDHWLAVDDALVREDYPDAQLLRERLRMAASRWPFPEQQPGRVRELTQRVESYYESGDNPKQRIL